MGKLGGMLFHVEHLSGDLSEHDVAELARDVGLALEPSQVRQTFEYARLLGRWNATTSLVQARSWDELLRRHVGEGWLAASLVPLDAPPGRALDVGSGGGIPAIPMAILRPEWRYTLLEPRQRKAAFLQAALRDLPARSEVLARRLDEVEDPSWDLVSFRGIRLDPSEVHPFVRPGGHVIRFPGTNRDDQAEWSGLFALERGVDLPTHPLRVELWRRG